MFLIYTVISYLLHPRAEVEDFNRQNCSLKKKKKKKERKKERKKRERVEQGRDIPGTSIGNDSNHPGTPHIQPHLWYISI
jgi:hypothetical protein